MRTIKTTLLVLSMAFCAFYPAGRAFGFEGRITATMTRGGDPENLLYIVGTNFLRIECLETDHPYPRDIIDLASGQLTLLFPHNRSFVHLPSADENTSVAPPVPLQMPPPAAGMTTPPGPANLPGKPARPLMPQMPNMPAPPPGIGPQSGAGAPTMPMLMMPPMAMEQVALTNMNDTTNILGYTCAHYEIRQRGEVMEIWGTDKLLPFQPWLQNQPHRFGPRMIEEQWGGLLKAKKLFPMLAVLKYQNGVERLRFQVTQIEAKKIEDKDGSLFQPPPDYQEIQPLPF